MTHDPVSVTLKHEEDGAPFSVTFHPTANIHRMSGLGLATVQVEDVQTLLLKLLPYEPQIMAWLAKSPANAAAFAQNPIAAVDQAGVEIPAALLDEVRALSARLAASAGGAK